MQTYTVKYSIGKRAKNTGHEVEVSARTPADAVQAALLKLPYLHGSDVKYTIDEIALKAPEPPTPARFTPSIPKLNTHDMHHIARCPVVSMWQLITSDNAAVHITKRATHHYGMLYLYSLDCDKNGDPIALLGWTTSEIVHSAYLQYVPTHTSTELRKLIADTPAPVKTAPAADQQKMTFAPVKTWEED